MSASDKSAVGRRAATGGRREGVAIIGMACRFPGAPDPDALWQRLSEGNGHDPPLVADGTVKPQGVLEGVDAFDAEFFKVNAQDAALIDPQQRLFLTCCFEAMETAGRAGSSGAARIGVFAGCGLNTYLINHVLPMEGIGVKAFPETARELQILLANAAASMPMRVSYALNLTGPSVNQQAACATGLVAVHAARRCLLAGECEMALAGAAAVRMPPHSPFRPEPGMILSRDGTCRAFDRDATGTVYGDGVGVVLLKRLRDAQRDGDPIHAVILGSAVNNDGSARLGFTAPSVDGQAAVLSAALQDADVDPSSIGYIEAHGTGTPLGDPVEFSALALAYGAASPVGLQQRARPCAIGSVKTRIGHCAEAAGIAGLIAAVLALKNRTLPAMRNFTALNPQIKLDATPFTISTEQRCWEQTGPRRAGVSAFGMGGTNAHVILEQAPSPALAPSAAATVMIPHVLPLSARSPTGLRTLARRFRKHLCLHRDARPEDICFSAAARRRSYSCRSAIVAASLPELRAKLRALSHGTALGTSSRRPPKIAFLFSGATSAVAGSGRELYAREPAFRETVDRCDAIVRDLGAPEIAPSLILLDAPLTSRGDLTRSQVASFTCGYALARMWLDWGVRPFVVLGHGFGEYTAACVAGMFEPAAALRLVIDHAQLAQSAPPGAMPDLDAAVAQARPTEPMIPFISSCSGCAVGPETIDPAHCFAQPRWPIRFGDGLARLQAMGADVFVDLSPDGSLTARARRCMPDRRNDVLQVLQRSPGVAPRDRLWSVSQTVATLFDRGATIDWASFHRARPARPCHLPPTPFESQSYWRGPRGTSASPGASEGASPRGGSGALPAALLDVAALKTALTSDQCCHYAEKIAALERRVPDLIVSALSELGGPVVPGALILPESRIAELPSERKRWISRLIAILEEEGLARRSDDGMCWTAGRHGGDGNCAACNDDDDLHTVTERTLVQRVGDRLAALIVGEADPLEALFPGGKDSLVADFYHMAPPLRALHAAMAEVVARLAARNGGRPLRLIEIGAGTLAITRAILARCPDGSLAYEVTDIGRSFLTNARRALRGCSSVTVRRLDIEQPAATQGFMPGSYDVIVAGNVLHATTDLSQSLRHAAELLCAGGTLIALEGTAPMRWIDLTFGALPGWWRFQDRDLRTSHPLLDSRAWTNLVGRSGFAYPTVLDATELAPAASALPQALVVAHAISDAAPAIATGSRQAVPAEPAAAGFELSIHRVADAEAAASETSSDLVTVVVQATAEMLGLAPEHVLIDRAFDELGLDSLAMLELRGNLERRIACPIPLDLIPADFSIARLVAAITSSNNSPLPSGATTAGVTAPNVLPLSRMTAGRPLVCLPSILGDFAALRPLVRHLEDNTIATVGLDLTPLRGTARESIPDRAARAVRALCARWTGGPYALIGHSFGGLLAYEVARQLEAGGAEVELVAIVDIQSDAHGAFSAHILDKAECLATVAKLIARSGRPTLEEPVQVARHFAASGVPLESSGLAALAARYQANRMALSEYRPTPSQSLPLLLLRSARRHPDDDFLPDAKRSMVDPSWGWQDLTSATVTPVLLPGDHLTMLAEPHVGALAGNLVLRLPRGVAHAAQVDRTKGATAHHVAI